MTKNKNKSHHNTASGARNLASDVRNIVKDEFAKGAEATKMTDKMNGDKMYDSVSKLSESFNLDGVKKVAAWYIDTSEKFANQALELQERANGWAKDTPLAPIFEAQNSMAKKLVERSVNVARNLWQIH